jgi:hypothetical protein
VAAAWRSFNKAWFPSGFKFTSSLSSLLPLLSPSDLGTFSELQRLSGGESEEKKKKKKKNTGRETEQSRERVRREVKDVKARRQSGGWANQQLSWCWERRG